MRNAMSGIGKEISALLRLVLFLFIGALFLGELSKLVPDNAAIQSLKGTYEFLTRLFIEFGSPDPTLWIIGILVAMVSGLLIWVLQTRCFGSSEYS
jgi:ABC-type Na+ efflux pump permease subunit